MPLPPDYDEPDKNYRVRVCLSLTQNPTIGLYTGSVVGVCDDCGQPIWINPNQPEPDLPDGMVLDGDLCMCFECIARHAAESNATALDPMTAEIMRKMGIGNLPPLTDG